MTNPGVAPSSPKRSVPWKWIAGGVAALAGLLALNQCDGDDIASGEQIDKDKPYYQIIKDARLRSGPTDDASYTGKVIKRGSCVQGVVDSEGKQKEGDYTYLVRAQDANGTKEQGYVSAGSVGMQNLNPDVEGFTCAAEFADKAEPKSKPTMPVAPTYTATQTVNLYDGGSRKAPIFGTLSKEACVTFTGDRADGLIQVGIASQASAPNVENYMWVREDQMEPSNKKPENCVAKWMEGAVAGTYMAP